MSSLPLRYINKESIAVNIDINDLSAYDEDITSDSNLQLFFNEFVIEPKRFGEDTQFTIKANTVINDDDFGAETPKITLLENADINEDISDELDVKTLPLEVLNDISISEDISLDIETNIFIIEENSGTEEKISQSITLEPEAGQEPDEVETITSNTTKDVSDFVGETQIIVRGSEGGVAYNGGISSANPGDGGSLEFKLDITEISELEIFTGNSGDDASPGGPGSGGSGFDDGQDGESDFDPYGGGGGGSTAILANGDLIAEASGGGGSGDGDDFGIADGGDGGGQEASGGSGGSPNFSFPQPENGGDGGTYVDDNLNFVKEIISTGTNSGEGQVILFSENQ